MESKVNDYQLRQGSQIYVFSTSIVNNLIRLACKNSYGKNFSRDFSYYEINSMDPIFNEINSEQDAIKIIDKALNKYKVGVREENGLIKIIFYVSNRGLLHPIEISLGEGGKYIYNENEASKFVESNQQIGIPSQAYGNTNYSYSGSNAFGQQSYYTSENIINSTTDSGFSSNNYGYDGQNVESIGSFNFQDNNQYTQTNYETTSSLNYGMRSLPTQILPTKLYSENFYNTNAYQNIYNQNSASNNDNFYSTTYENSYQTNGSTAYDLNSLNNINNYGDINNQFNQQALESTAFTGETFQGNEHTAKVKPIIKTSLTKTNSLKSIGAINNKNKIQSEYETHTTPPLINATSLQFKNIQNENKNQSNSANKNNLDQNYSRPQKPTNEKNISINESEIQRLKNKAAEADSLRAQLAQLMPLKQQFDQINILKSQLDELNSLREKAAELNSIKAQLNELNDLRKQVSQMNILKKKLEEMESLKEKVEETETLKKRIEILEKSNIEYEKEIKELRASQLASPINLKSPNQEKNIFEKIDLTFKEKSEKKYVKGDIIHDAKELEMLTRKINKFNRKLTLNLLYKATADSDKAIAFHKKCDDAKSSIVLVETDKGKRFGGFTTCSWSGECIDKKDEEAFIFSLDKMKIYENIPEEDAIGCYPKFGPIFLGCQIRIYDNAFKNGGTTFEKGLNYDTEEDYELTDGERQFNVKEIEVCEGIPQ